MNRRLALALQRAEFLSSRERFRILASAETEEEFRALDRDALSELLGRRVQSAVWEPARLLMLADRDRRYLSARGIRTVLFSDPEYPEPLKEIYDPPLLLYVHGARLSRLQHGIAVVGTRRPSATAFAAAYQLGREAAAGGWTLVSGLAHGIDTAAHRGAVSGYGASIAVLGSGIDVVYPRGNRGLCRLMLERGGSVVSEYPPGLQPLAYRFPERNRIISGLCGDVIVVQAPASSGALITAEYALDQGREVYVHSDGVFGAAGEGTAALHGEGAVKISSLAELQSWSAEPQHDYRAGRSDSPRPRGGAGGAGSPGVAGASSPGAEESVPQNPVPVGKALARELAAELSEARR